MELMIPRHLLDDRAVRSVFLKHNEVPNQIEKPTLIKNATQQHFKLGQENRRKCFAFNRAPRHEALFVGANCSDARFQAIGDHGDGVMKKE
jgi:hypothetical protein